MAVIQGTGDADVLVGTNSVDFIWGFAGADLIQARRCADWVEAGSGNDIVQVASGRGKIARGIRLSPRRLQQLQRHPVQPVAINRIATLVHALRDKVRRIRFKHHPQRAEPIKLRVNVIHDKRPVRHAGSIGVQRDRLAAWTFVLHQLDVRCLASGRARIPTPIPRCTT